MRFRLTAVLMGLAVVTGGAPAQETRPAPGAPAPDRVVASLMARLGAPKALDTRALAAELAALPEEERIEQLRDWALLAAVAQIDAGAALDWGRLAPALPPSLRRPYLNDLRELPYGTGRLAMVGPDVCVAVVPAVVPAGDGAAPSNAGVPRYRFEVLCRLLDERRMLDGRLPERVLVVAYEADPRHAPPAVTLTYVGSLRGATFETPAYGFEVARVGSRQELAEFLRWADDLLAVRSGPEGTIELTGRRYPSGQFRRDYRRLDVADLETIRRADGEHPDRPGRRSASALGFSLDPWIDPQPLAAGLLAYAAGPKRFSDESRRAIETIAGRLAGATPFQVPTAPEDDDTRLFALLEAARPARADRPAGEAPQGTLDDLVQRHSFQSPIYFGKIQGTEVGMTLYYTDLMAKLYMMGGVSWGAGREEPLELPDTGTSRFVPALEIPLAAFHRAEDQRLNRGRLWWGPRPAGFLRPDSGTLRFAPVATRLFMKSKAAETAREESANLRFGSFCARWNQAFLAVADTNPEYHRLNQIMKWSVVFLAAETSGRDPWSILDDVAVPDDVRFREWYEQGRAAGRLAGPQRLPFLAARPGVAEDALEILHSQQYETGSGRIEQLSGGVDTATPEQIELRTLPPGAIPPAGLPRDVSPTTTPPGGWDKAARWPLEEGGVLTRTDGGKTVAVTRDADPLKTTSLLLTTPADIGPVTFRIGLDVGVREGAGLVVKDALERGGRTTELGALTIRPASGETISLDWEPRGLDRDVTMAQTIMAGGDLAGGTVYASGEGRVLYVRSGAAPERWLEVVAGTDPSAPGMKVGVPGAADWAVFTTHDAAPVRAADLTPVTAPHVVVGRVRSESRPAPGRAPPSAPRRTWLPPATALRWEVAFRGERGTIGVTEQGDLVASGKLGSLLLDLTPADLAALQDAMLAEVRQGQPAREVMLADAALRFHHEGSGWVLRREAVDPEGVLSIRRERDGLGVEGRPEDVRRAMALLRAYPNELPAWAARMERVTLAKLEEYARMIEGVVRGPLDLESTPDGILLRDQQGRPVVDLLDVEEAQNRGAPALQAYAELTAQRALVVNVSKPQSSELVDRMNQIVLDSGQTSVNYTDLPGSAQRLKGLLNTDRRIQIQVDESVTKIKQYGTDAIEILSEYGEVGPQGGNRLRVILAHSDDAGGFARTLAEQGRSGGFAGEDVFIMICNLDAAAMRTLRDVILRGGATSVTFPRGAVDVRAGTLVLERLKVSTASLDGTPVIHLGRKVYAEALQTLRACLKERDPAAAIRDAFGERASRLLLRDGAVRDPHEIQEILDALEQNGGSFIPCVDRAGPPRLRLAA